MRHEIRTSSTHPVRVDWLVAPENQKGGIGLTFAPGKRAAGEGGTWQRDLAEDLRRLREHYRADVLVPLVTDAELRLLHIEGLVQKAEAHGFEVLRFPFADGSVPSSLGLLDPVLLFISESVRCGKRVVVHCRGGLGRAGLVGACWLLRTGRARTAEEAIAAVRRARSPRAVETTEQEAFVAQYAEWLQKRDEDQKSARPSRDTIMSAVAEAITAAANAKAPTK